ncbi:gamma-glutamyltransferase [Vittaforma corneae ATCC 50505]|uniref:Gamma-glutamyltransferase n=1 Tax=Vittaforma corneae (strain ATCC 50505) TaxID=993615 RepID=L2GNS9_VITCO|nr:gamma-glutamyltransferase [Vittaforma corneae ATCC 50505]ELA42496.1 gamma-glutamyltransferase [Vittaforma corneae ATCC 50505]
MFMDDQRLATTTGLSVGVPGEVLGFYEVHKEYGKLPWKDLFTDAIEISKKFKVSNILEQKLIKNSKYIFDDPGLKSTYTRNEDLVKEGDIIERDNLSKTLEILSNDPLSFYTGTLAKQIVDFLNSKGGVFTLEDLKEYEVKKRSVLKGHFYDFQVYTTNLPTSGLFIIEALKILERINIRDLFILSNNENSFYLYHILIEVFKFMAAERGKFEDPEFLDKWQKKVSLIISDIKATSIFRQFSLKNAMSSEEYRNIPFYKEDHGTTHLNVIDKDGMIVSLTSTINLEFGSKLLDPITGIIFNNQIDDFYIPGIDNTFGLEKMPANILEGGKRPFSSAAPTILIKDNEILIIGAAGGTRIPTAIITTIVYLLAGNTLERAVSLCRIHNQLFPIKTMIEPTLPDRITEKLREMGHEIEFSELNTSFSSVQAIYLRKSTDNTSTNGKGGDVRIEAISDKRKQGLSDGK